MPTDYRSVHELLLDADLTARNLLLRIDTDRAPAMIRSWPAVTHAAQALWASFPSRGNDHWSGRGLPPAPMHTAIEQAVADAETLRLGRGQTNRRDGPATPWPPPGDLDSDMTQIGQDLMRAADLIDRHAGSDRAARPWTDGHQADLAAAAIRATHSVYVAAHAAAITCEEFAADVRAHTGPRDFVQLRPALQCEHAARLLRDTEYVTGHALTHPGTPHPRPAPPAQPDTVARLAKAARDWNRSTLEEPDEPLTAGQTRWIAHINAIVIAGTAAIAHAQHHLDGNGQDDLHAVLRSTHRQWTRLERDLSHISDAADRPTPTQILTGNELTAALRDLTWDHDHAATPENLSRRADPSHALLALNPAHRRAQTLAGDIAAAAAHGDLIAHARPVNQHHRATSRSQTRRAEIPAEDVSRNTYVALPPAIAETIEHAAADLARAGEHCLAVLRQSMPEGSYESFAAAIGRDAPLARTRRASHLANLMNTPTTLPGKTGQNVQQAENTFTRGTDRITRLRQRLDDLDSRNTRQANTRRRDQRRSSPARAHDGPRSSPS